MNTKIIVVVCIFDRFENLRRWAHAWSMSETTDAKLFFINNHYAGVDTSYWEQFCKNSNINYQIRPNIGYETGIIQDVVTKTLLSEEDWDVLFFVTDDTIPMKKTFIQTYIKELEKPDVGLVCMEISGQVTPHVRTTGWCVTKQIAEEIQFPEGIIDDKSKCYHFEHTGGEDTLMSQILRMGKRVVQISSLENSEIWDTHHTPLNRWEQWHTEFPGYNI
jgi:hypothetical protein